MGVVHKEVDKVAEMVVDMEVSRGQSVTLPRIFSGTGTFSRYHPKRRQIPGTRMSHSSTLVREVMDMVV